MSIVGTGPLLPRTAYDRVAEVYRQWRWYWFWRTNEAPLVTQWLWSIGPGRGLDAGSGTGPYLRFAAGLGHCCIAVDLSLRMLRFQERLADLAEQPPRTEFAKLYQHPDRPIFYVARLVKRGLAVPRDIESKKSDP